MPEITYLDEPPQVPPEHSRLAAALWDEFQEATGFDYYVRERTILTTWLGDDLIEYRYDLLYHSGGPEYQIMGCVSREKELIAYMYGTINRDRSEDRPPNFEPSD